MIPLSQYLKELVYVTAHLEVYINTHDPNISVPISAEAKQGTYTASLDYLAYCSQFHYTPPMEHFFCHYLAAHIQDGQNVLEVGCLTGTSGLVLGRLKQVHLSFHDFEGLGLDFIRVYCQLEGIKAEVIPYAPTGLLRGGYDWVLALDVLEHTGNHLGFIKWVASLGYNVALCYPITTYFSPPHVAVLDEWVDDEAIQWTIERRYKMIVSYCLDGRRYMIFSTI